MGLKNYSGLNPKNLRDGDGDRFREGDLFEVKLDSRLLLFLLGVRDLFLSLLDLLLDLLLDRVFVLN